MAGEVALGVAALGEVIKLLIQLNDARIKAGLTPEQFKALSDAVDAGFQARDPANLPEK